MQVLFFASTFCASTFLQVLFGLKINFLGKFFKKIACGAIFELIIAHLERLRRILERKKSEKSS